MTSGTMKELGGRPTDPHLCGWFLDFQVSEWLIVLLSQRAVEMTVVLVEAGT